MANYWWVIKLFKISYNGTECSVYTCLVWQEFFFKAVLHLQYIVDNYRQLFCAINCNINFLKKSAPNFVTTVNMDTGEEELSPPL